MCSPSSEGENNKRSSYALAVGQRPGVGYRRRTPCSQYPAHHEGRGLPGAGFGGSEENRWRLDESFGTGLTTFFAQYLIKKGRQVVSTLVFPLQERLGATKADFSWPTQWTSS